jgi:hypothetical protein
MKNAQIFIFGVLLLALVSYSDCFGGQEQIEAKNIQSSNVFKLIKFIKILNLFKQFFFTQGNRKFG